MTICFRILKILGITPFMCAIDDIVIVADAFLQIFIPSSFLACYNALLKQFRHYFTLFRSRAARDAIFIRNYKYLLDTSFLKPRILNNFTMITSHPV